MAEQSSVSGEGDFRRAQLAQDPVPLIHINPISSAGYSGDDLPEVAHLVWGQQQRHVERVNHPPQEILAGGPGAVSCIHIIQGQELLSVRLAVDVYGSEHLFHCMEQGDPDVASPMGGTLV